MEICVLIKLPDHSRGRPKHGNAKCNRATLIYQLLSKQEQARQHALKGLPVSACWHA